MGLLVVALGFLPAVIERYRTPRAQPRSTARLLAFWGPAWWFLSVAPLIVTYLTPRHLYLAAVGVAITLGLGFEVLRRANRATWRYAGLVAGAGLLAVCIVGLQPAVTTWTISAGISEKIARDLQGQATDAPPGSLLVVGARRYATLIDTLGSRAATIQLEPPPGRPWLWSWAMPYASQPPFLVSDVAERVLFVEPFEVYCCTLEQWHTHTREAIVAWSGATPERPAIVLSWDATTGGLTQRSDADDQCLRREILLVADSNDPDIAVHELNTILDRVRGAPATSTCAG
jgi:hypothetical protein